MALKDWKKKYENYYVRKDNEIKIVHIFQNKLHSPKLWYVDINDYFRYEVKSFKTKSQALRFAKSYMRKH